MAQYKVMFYLPHVYEAENLLQQVNQNVNDNVFSCRRKQRVRSFKQIYKIPRVFSFLKTIYNVNIQWLKIEIKYIQHICIYLISHISCYVEKEEEIRQLNYFHVGYIQL